jgi:hypothetical protein
MKKTLLVIVLVCAALGAVSAQEGAGGAAASTMADIMLNLNAYSDLFKNSVGTYTKYSRKASTEDHDRIAALGGEYLDGVDTPLEIALLSTCAGVVDVRPVEASRILGNAKQADLKLGAAVLQEAQVLRFLGNMDAVGRHEGILKFITDRGNVTRAEIESYYRQGIGASVAEAVNTKFNEDYFGFIAASVYADWKAKGVAGGVDAVALMKETLTNFYIEPTQDNYRKLVGIDARLYKLATEQKDEFARSVSVSFIGLLENLNAELARKSATDARNKANANYPADSRFDVFSTPYATGGGDIDDQTALFNEANRRR